MKQIIYIDEPEPLVVHAEARPQTLLDISRTHGIPHFHECGGRGRCTTCRVAVVEGEMHLSPRTNRERALARARGWGDRIRLACQTEARGDVAIKRLFHPTDDDVRPRATERSVVALVCDIRSFTHIADKQLPFDVVHILNQYFEGICEPFLAHGGYIDKYMGDGLLGFFGIDRNDDDVPATAVRSALEMTERAKRMRGEFAAYYQVELSIGIALHYGTVILGEVGHHSKRQLTAIGDVVNVASKIEKRNKALGTEILATEELFRLVEDAVVVGRTFSLELEGKEDAQIVREILGMRT